MVSERVDLRALLYDLPELLAGPEPVLDAPKARAYITAHPEARAALLLAGSVARAMKTGVERLGTDPTLLAPRIGRSVARAARAFQMPLVEVLFELGLYYVGEATRGTDEYYSHATDRCWAPGDADRTRASVERMAAVISDLGAAAVPIARVISASDVLDSDGSWDRARLVFDACETLVPGLEGVGFWRVLIRNRGRDSRAAWKEFARKAKNPAMRAAGIHAVAYEHAQETDFATAVRYERLSIQLTRDRHALAHHGVLHSVLAGDSKSAGLFRDHVWAEFVTNDTSGSRRRGIVSWIDHNSISWREAFARNAPLAERVVRDLPNTLSDAILENRS